MFCHPSHLNVLGSSCSPQRAKSSSYSVQAQTLAQHPSLGGVVQVDRAGFTAQVSWTIKSTFHPTTRYAFLPSAGRSIQPPHIRSTTDQQNSPKKGCCWSKPRPGGLFTSYLFSTKTVQNSYKTLVWGWAMTLIQKIIPMQSHQFHNLQGNR